MTDSTENTKTSKTTVSTTPSSPNNKYIPHQSDAIVPVPFTADTQNTKSNLTEPIPHKQTKISDPSSNTKEKSNNITTISDAISELKSILKPLPGRSHLRFSIIEETKDILYVDKTEQV